MRECVGDSQIQSCGCAERRFAKRSGLVCDTLMNRTAGVKISCFTSSTSVGRSERIVISQSF